MPVPLYLSGVVIIFAFLVLGKNISFSDSLLEFPEWRCKKKYDHF
jgi:hypothetical protein